MNTNRTQTGAAPSELSPENNINTFDLHRLISHEAVVTSQPLLQVNTNDMIPSPIQNIPTASELNNLSRRQLRQVNRQQQHEQRQRQIE